MASTFENDLRLEEIGTGEQSGTWGATTNTNMELIAEAFSYGTEAITTNADTHATVVADGATDEGRSMYLKYTGALDSTCTITISAGSAGTFTLSKVWLIENATTGGQSIIITSGSGASITIANGQVKMVATDGAGSGGIVYDLLQDLAVPDLFVDDDLTLQSDGAVLGFGEDTDVTLTHVEDTGLLLNAAMKVQFRDSAISISSSADATLDLAADGDINLTAGVDINIPADVGLTFGNDGEKIEGDGTDLTIAGNNINLTAVEDVNIPSGVGLTFATAEKIESDGTDLSITVGSGGDINIPANIGLTFGDDGEKIEGDGTDLTISGNNINLTAVEDVVVPANVGITFGTGEKIEGDNTDLTITSGAKINLAANSDVHLANNIGMVFGDAGEKIEGDGTNLAINSSGDVNITATTVDLNGNLEVSGTITLGSGAVISEAELELLDDVTAGTAIASKVVTTDANIDTTGQRNLTITGELDAATGDFSGAVDIAGDLTLSAGADGALNFSAASSVKILDNNAASLVFEEADNAYMTFVTTNSSEEVQFDVNVDLNGDLDVSGTGLVTGVLTTTATQVATGGITSGSNIVSDTDSTDDLGTNSVRWANLYVDGITATDQITATGFTGTLDGILGSGSAAAATVTTLDSSGAVNLNLTTDSTSSTSGALIVDGGVGIAKKLFVGTDLVVSGDLTVSGDDITMGTNTSGNLLVADGTNFNSIAVSSLSEISTAADNDVLIAIDTSGGGLKKITRSAIIAGTGSSGDLANVVEDTSPQLGANLDTNSHNILIDDAHFIGDENGNEQIIFQTTSSAVNQFDITNAATGNAPEISATGGDTNISLKITPKGTGQVLIDGNVGIESGLIDLKNAGTVSQIKFYCESSNAHAQTLQSAPHSESASNTLTLPSTGGNVNLVSTASTATLTNKGFGDNVSFGDNNITNVGDIALDSISADATDINVAVSDNSATALTIKQGSDAYLIIDTANSSESVSIGTGISGTAIVIGHSTSETTVSDNLTVTGDLTVNGTTTTIATTNLTVTDHLIKLGQTYTGSANDQGIIITRGDGSDSNTANRGFIWDESADEFATVFANTEAGTTTGNVSIDDYADIHVGKITADDASTFSGAVTAAALTVDDVAVNGKVITMTGSSSDTAVFTVGTNGTLSIVTTDAAAAAANIQITADGTAELAGTTVTLDSAGDIELEATNDINIPANVGLTFGTGEKIEGDSTDLTITSGNKINLTATTDVHLPNDVGIVFGDAGEKIEGDGTDLTISGNKINLAAATDVVIPADVGITFGTGEKIEGDSTDLTITSGNKINLTATTDVHLPNDVGMVFGDAGEKIEGDGTNLTVASSNNLTLDVANDLTLDVEGNIEINANGGTITFKDASASLGTITSSGYSGLAGTATALATARTIGGVSFDGSANINLPGVNTGGNQNTTGSAATLTTARTINGTSFDGSANITLGTGSVTHAMLAGDAVDGDNIADDSVNSEHYVNGSIDTAHIADSQITVGKMAANSVDSNQYVDGSIDTAHIADNQVTLAKMAGLARGKIIYGNSSGDPAALSIGSNGTVLKSDGTDISWGTIASGVAADDITAGDSNVEISTSSGTITIDAKTYTKFEYNNTLIGEFGYSSGAGYSYLNVGTSTANSNGYIGLGTGQVGFFAATTGSTVVCRSGGTPFYVDRLASDGSLIDFYQQGSGEGSISVSGSTVSYNGFSGLHESSGISDDIAVGTVVSTIDELDVYSDTILDVEGEIKVNSKKGRTRADHAKIKVSDTEGDKRVYGVLQRYDDNGKPLVASVGIGSIKVTGACEGGDLLESNGDGTAKVQSDDVIRSKTIGKVTISNNTTSVKLVSCVLYCG